MSSQTVMKAMIGFYILIFFTYLFGPLVVMGVTAFNTPNYPQAYPFEGFTLKWFAMLAKDEELLTGLKTSVLIGIGVVCVSVPVGLAGAIFLLVLGWVGGLSSYYSFDQWMDSHKNLVTNSQQRLISGKQTARPTNLA